MAPRNFWRNLDHNPNEPRPNALPMIHSPNLNQQSLLPIMSPNHVQQPIQSTHGSSIHDRQPMPTPFPKVRSPYHVQHPIPNTLSMVRNPNHFQHPMPSSPSMFRNPNHFQHPMPSSPFMFRGPIHDLQPMPNTFPMVRSPNYAQQSTLSMVGSSNDHTQQAMPSTLSMIRSPNHIQPQQPMPTTLSPPIINNDQSSSHEQPKLIAPHSIQSSYHGRDQGSNRKQKRPRLNKDNATDKQKVSTIPAIIFSVGSWKWHSIRAGDLIVKFYYGRKKLVWEFLDGSLKKKMEVAWSDIIALKATTPRGQPGVLQIELRIPPSFSQETPPEPRMHTKWKPTSDFTQNQALHNWILHTTFPAGELDEHLEKLFKFDQTLFELTKKPFPSPDSSSYFVSGSIGDLTQTSSQPHIPPSWGHATTSTPNVPLLTFPPMDAASPLLVNWADMGGSDHHQQQQLQQTAWVHQNLEDGGVINPAVPRIQQQIVQNNAHAGVQMIHDSPRLFHPNIDDIDRMFQNASGNAEWLIPHIYGSAAN